MTRWEQLVNDAIMIGEAPCRQHPSAQRRSHRTFWWVPNVAVGVGRLGHPAMLASWLGRDAEAMRSLPAVTLWL